MKKKIIFKVATNYTFYRMPLNKKKKIVFIIYNLKMLFC